MKLRILALITIFTNIVFSQSYHDTQGKLEISNDGQASFKLPVAMPPSINDFGPKIDINYVSGQSSGIAGLGWNINGLSKITRINTRFDIDGFVDGVDFDENDKLALDGQRLIIKSGTYWTDGAVYQTEFQSNLKIQQFGSGTNLYFVVTQPDGTKNWYGNYNVTNANELTSYLIVRTEDTDGNFVLYNYNRPFSASLCIDNIQFSANTFSNAVPLNKIKFYYDEAKRHENGYLNGVKIVKKEILNRIEVLTNDLLFKKYQFNYSEDADGYQRMNKCQEYNGNSEAANPIEFSYPNQSLGGSITSFSRFDMEYNFNSVQLVNDFDGDNIVDFVLSDNRLYFNALDLNSVGYTHSISVGNGKKISGNVLFNNKLVQHKTLITIEENLDNLKFKANIFERNGTTLIQNNYIKTVNYDNFSNCVDYCVDGFGNCEEIDEFGNVVIVPCNTNDCPTPTKKLSNQYIEGDFNGDGLSEVLILGFNDIMRYGPMSENNGRIVDPENPCVWVYEVSKHLMKINLIDLRESQSTIEGTKGNVNIDNTVLLGDGKRYVIDYNGDSKSDLLCFNDEGSSGSYRVIGFKQLNVSPWVEMEVLAQGYVDKYSTSKEILFGDYNGDGKTDFMLPEGDTNDIGEQAGSDWHIYYANPNTSNLNSFIKETHTITGYNPIKTFPSGQAFWNYYLPIDANKDGKTDLVRMEVWYHQVGDVWTGYHWEKHFTVSSFINGIGNGNFNNSFFNDYNSPSLGSLGTHFPLVVNQRNNGLESDFLLISRYSPFQVSPNSNTTVISINFNKNFRKQNLLSKVAQSNNKIIDEIYYKNPIGSKNNMFYGVGTDFYSSDNSLQYPFVEIKGINNSSLVSKITNTTLGIKKSKDYFYKGLSVNLDGVGFVGYRKNAQTAWYLDTDSKKTWNVTESDPSKRGAILKNYSMFLSNPFNFDMFYINQFSEINYEYLTAPNGTFPYYILAKKEISKDYLTNVISEKENISYSPDYFLPLVVKNKKYLGSVLQGETTISTDYDITIDNSNSYIVGMPVEINTTSVIYANTVGSSNTKTSIEKFSYSNNRLDKTEKTANGSSETLVEEFTYFPNGLLQLNKISAIGTSSLTAVVPRTTEYTYDSTNRFVKTTKAPNGLITTNNTYDDIYGLVKTQTNPYGLTTTSVFDTWGKRLKITDFLGKSITYSYSRSADIYKTTEVGDDDSESIIEQDVLARVIRKGAKDLNGNWNYIKTEYDQYGREYRVSEPYGGSGSPTQWTTTEFDDYSRPIKITAHTGKIVSTDYDELSVTASEPTMTKNKTMNALGFVISSTDTPGGTITYKYDASGNMLESDYDGIIMNLTYDNWGRKMSLVDTSAGPYSYSYDAFGQVKTEVTPNGSTAYTYDDFGKILTKKVIALIPGTSNLDTSNTTNNTHITSIYSYDVNNRIEKIDVFNLNDGNNKYLYYYDDTTKQLKTTIETLYPVGSTTPIATFTKELTFDLFGRVDTETSTSSAFSKSSTKTMKRVYQNGVLWKLFDGANLKWQANTTNARGQLTSLTLDNRINISNTYDNFGYQTQSKHDISTTNIMTLNTVFEPILGNLTSRYNSMFNTKEDFKYDYLDRLISWDGISQNILNLPFNTTTDGFTFTSTSTYGSVTNSVGTLKVVLKATDPDFPIAAQKSLTLGLTNGDKISVKATITNKTGTGGVIVNAVMVETDPADSSNYIEYVIGTIQNGTFEKDYTVSNFVPNPLLKLRFVIDESSPVSSNGGGIVPPNTTFYVDNFKIDKVVVYSQNYDDRGRITQNNLGTYNYDVASNHPYQNKKINLNAEANTYYASRPTQDITYNAFKGAIQIEQPNIDKISFAYNGMEERSIMYWGNTNTDKLTRPYRRYYSADGSMEIKATFASGNALTPINVEFLTYLDGDAYSSSIVLKSDGTTQNYFYLHRDYQGSVLAITNATGVVIEKRLFDAWGAIVKVQDGTGNNLTKLTFFDRGYTGHEHLESVGLINMNARLYDPKLHRFLQADNLIQDTNNTQNYNRYAYCVNNPLKYTDVTGNSYELGVGIIIGVAIALTMHIVNLSKNHQKFNVLGATGVAGVSVFSSVVTFGIGEAVGTIGNFYLQASVQALAHGLVQGGLYAAQGGKFWTGFASGAISSLVSSAWTGGEHVRDNGNQTMSLTNIEGIGSGASDAGTLFFGTISGGAGAALTGGNFWQGAATGLVVSGLNHYLHRVNYIRTLKSRFNNVNPDAKPTFDEQGTQSLLNDVDGLREAYNWSGGNKKIDYNFTEDEGITITTPGKEGFSFNKSELTSNWKLVSAMFHEFRHGLHYWGSSQLYSKWMSKFNNDIEKTLWYMERDAYRYELNMGSPSRSAIEGFNKFNDIINGYENRNR